MTAPSPKTEEARPRSWTMWAGPSRRPSARSSALEAAPAAPGGETEPVEYADFGSHINYTRAFGHTDPVRVRLTENCDGPYWGWLNTDATHPTMVYRRKTLFQICFPYSPDNEQAAGRGEILRLSVEAAPDEDS